MKTNRAGWQEVAFEFTSSATDRQASLELVATGTGSVLVDFISLMRRSARASGKLRPDLLAALQGLAPPFIRWPGGSYASIYKWKDGIGPAVSRKYNPNTIWGGYSDYYGFGTDEFLELCRQLGAAPMIVLAATGTDPAQLEYALEWVHYLVDPPTTEWGRRRAANGHPEPYRVPYIQIDNEPMNHKLSPDEYAAIVNLYGPRLREIAPQSKIVACGQKRSNDMNWSEKLIDLAGQNFDILGSHNYEYEPENYATGVRRIEDYLEKLIEYVRRSAHPEIEIAVLEWGAARTYDWRAGLHAAGQPALLREAEPGPGPVQPGAADAQHHRRSRVALVDLPRPRVVVRGLRIRGREAVPRLLRAPASRLHVRHVQGHPPSRGVLRRDLADEARGLDAEHRGRDRHQHGRRPSPHHQGRELRRRAAHPAHAPPGLEACRRTPP